jgi:hypothetical protein
MSAPVAGFHVQADLQQQDVVSRDKPDHCEKL